MESTSRKSSEACPVPGCGKPCSGHRRGDTLHVKCLIHGDVRYDFETDTISYE